MKNTGSNKMTGAVNSNNSEIEKAKPHIIVEIIEGNANIVINKVSNLLENGQGIIIPAHAPNQIMSNGRFKMISTVIKSGYE